MKILEKFRPQLSNLNWFLTAQVGVDIKKIFYFFPSFIRYIKDLIRFRFYYNGSIELKPCFHDTNSEAGDLKNEYFWQDFYAAQIVLQKQPKNILDVGSRIDGFVAHVASSRPIDVLDIRPMSSDIDNIKFIQHDLMEDVKISAKYSMVSCLHALEHFGLGRYGDKLDLNGPEKGIKNISKVLKPDGVLMLATPCGIPCIQFNANRIFDPQQLINLCNQAGFELLEIYEIRNNLKPIKIEISDKNLEIYQKKKYTLLLFLFAKREDLCLT